MSAVEKFELLYVGREEDTTSKCKMCNEVISRVLQRDQMMRKKSGPRLRR